MVALTEEEKVRFRESWARMGETVVRDELKRDKGSLIGVRTVEDETFAYNWLREKEAARERHELSTHWYVKWTFWAAIAAALIGVAGIAATLLSGH